MKKFTFLLSLLFLIVSLQAQDYLISFTGTGASTTIGTITVENLSQGKIVTLSGTEVLHLAKTITGIDPILDQNKALLIYPNPTKGKSILEFVSITSDKANIELFDISGKRIVTEQASLLIGTNSFLISGLGNGIFTVRISSQAYIYTGKIVSNGTPNSKVKISYIGNSSISVTSRILKSASTEKAMQYNTGDRLKITGKSGIYSTVIVDRPTQNKTITFNFVACNDADGNNYPVVQIGTQIWMAENLKTTKYRNGDLIGTTTPATLDIFNQASPKYQWAYDGIESNVATYGRLYTWFAVTDTRNACPTGWHLPSDAEWTTMENHLIASGYNYDGTTTDNKLAKALAAITDWAISTGTGAPGNGLTKNNLSGFAAFPGGYRLRYGTGNLGSYGAWWSSTAKSTFVAWSRRMHCHDSDMSRESDYKTDGFSVRCIRD